MASIKALRDSNNETIYPQTLTNAIFDLNNQSLDNLLALKMDASKVYTKEEMNNIISTLSSLKFEVLQKNEDGTIPDLPAIGDTDTIYLRPKENDDTNNYYDEYVYLENGTYEKIGDTKVDLSNYYTKGEADTKFAKLSLYGDTAINVGRKADTIAGGYSTAEGKDTTASDLYTHAEGAFTTASAVSAHAEGASTTASGYGAHAEGGGTIAAGIWQHVEGRYNKEDTGNTYIHIAGNGADSESPSNAHTLDWEGNSWYQGSIKCGGTGYDDAPNNVITSGSVVKVWTGTQAEYDVLTTKDATTLYMITG